MTVLLRTFGMGAALLAAIATPALGQARCTVPASLPAARAEFPPPGSAVNAPITGYQLVMRWGPQFCKVHGEERSAAAQCKQQKFGFTLQDLRADGAGRKNPVYCRRMGPVTETVARASYCAIPSVPDMSHAWAKYGSCIAADPAGYFTAGRSAFEALVWPDMNALSQQRLDVAKFRSAVAAANPGLRPEMFAVGLTPLGWLETLRLCLDRDRRPRACPGDVPGASDDATVRIWPSY